MKRVIVAGHVCVDLTPTFDTPPPMEPGRLIAVGPLALVAGGCVSNTGLALASLGVPTQLVASAGADELGRVLVALLATSAADTTGITLPSTVEARPTPSLSMFRVGTGACGTTSVPTRPSTAVA